MKTETKTTIKGALQFCLCILPFAIAAGIGTAYYTEGTGIVDLTQAGMSQSQLIVTVTIQTLVYAMVCGFFGYILSGKVALRRSFGFSGKATRQGLLLGTVCGVAFFLLDYLIFAALIPQVAEFYAEYNFSFAYFMSEIFYGGVVEELIMRWFLMSGLALILWKIFARKYGRESIPVWIFIVSNIVVAMLFAAGHLPATVSLYGQLTGIILLRCFVLNGFFGLVFGYLYRKLGIQYAMIAHAMTHIVCDAMLYAAVYIM